MKSIFLAAAVSALFAISVSTQEMSDQPIVSKTSAQKYAAVPGFPDCATLAPLRGDPSKGSSVVEIKMTPGCIVPWHWHSNPESAIPLSGLIEVSMQNEKPVILTNGDFGYIPAKHIHQAKCTGSKPCAAVFLLDGPFDIHYVDKSGLEIPAEKALADAEKLMLKQGAKPSPKP
jgi:quercetin dioxygenase-like cupin family protein